LKNLIYIILFKIKLIYFFKIINLQSNPILVDRDHMKVNFDKEAIDYLVNDMTYVFRERQYSVDANQVLFNLLRIKFHYL